MQDIQTHRRLDCLQFSFSCWLLSMPFSLGLIFFLFPSAQWTSSWENVLLTRNVMRSCFLRTFCVSPRKTTLPCEGRFFNRTKQKSTLVVWFAYLKAQTEPRFHLFKFFQKKTSLGFSKMMLVLLTALGILWACEGIKLTLCLFCCAPTSELFVGQCRELWPC